MRKQQRLKALLGAVSLSAALVATGATGVTPAHAHSVGDAPATAANLEALRWCESTNNYSINTGNGYYGAYQFSLRTWQWLGYGGYPHQAAPGVQDQAAIDLFHYSGWSPWPGCSKALGLR